MVALSGLQPGSQVTRTDLQSAADILVKSGLFANVKYNFNSNTEGVAVVFHVVESPRVSVLFDNIPWFTVQELNDAIRARLPFYSGTLPEGGVVVDTAADAVAGLLKAHRMDAPVEHQLIGSPDGDGNVQMFRIDGPDIKVSKLEFADPTVGAERAVQAHLHEVVGKPFSRMAVDVFLTEQVRPIFDRRGLLRAKLGPAEVRLTGNPNEALPTQIPVFVPVEPGPVYHYMGVKWQGNNLLSTITLDNEIGMKIDDVADGMALAAAWEKVREAYGQRGYLDAKVEPTAAYDDVAHTVRYTANISEGPQYKMGSFVLTGISPTGESKIKETFPVQAGQVFDKQKYEHYLTNLQLHRETIFGNSPIHYDTVGHWLRPDTDKGTVDVLLDFK